MNKEDILLNAVSVEEHLLGELQHWLQYGKHTWALVAGTFWIPYSLILMGLKIIAFIFTPYMIWHLFKAKWHKSVIALFVAVILPFVTLQFIELGNQVFDFVLMFLPFLTLYLYIYILSYMIEEKLSEIKTLKRWKREEMYKN